MENFLPPPREEPGSLDDDDDDDDDESKLLTEDGGVRGSGFAMACWFWAAKRGRAEVASRRVSRTKRKMTRSFMVMDGWDGGRLDGHISL